jgi:hypothetical protein
MFAILYSYGWHESFGIMVSVCVGFLYIENYIFTFSVYRKVQEINGVVFLFFNGKFYTSSVFIEFCLCFIYICFALITNYENVVYVSKISNYSIFP